MKTKHRLMKRRLKRRLMRKRQKPKLMKRRLIKRLKKQRLELRLKLKNLKTNLKKSVTHQRWCLDFDDSNRDENRWLGTPCLHNMFVRVWRDSRTG
jgi:uncharacterized membrane protein